MSYKKIVIGDRVTIGARCIVLGGAIIGDGATVAINSLVLSGTVIGPDEFWGGTPARKISKSPSPSTSLTRAS